MQSEKSFALEHAGQGWSWGWGWGCVRAPCEHQRIIMSYANNVAAPLATLTHLSLGHFLFFSSFFSLSCSHLIFTQITRANCSLCWPNVFSGGRQAGRQQECVCVWAWHFFGWSKPRPLWTGLYGLGLLCAGLRREEMNLWGRSSSSSVLNVQWML